MAKDDALKRLGGGRWETRDGRFQIEPQSGTWVIVDTTQTNEFGLPLVRGPFPSLGAAKEAIEDARAEGPVESPLAERLEKGGAPTATKPPKSKAASKADSRPEPEPEPPPAEPPPPPEPNPMRALLLQLVTDHVSKVAVPYTLLARLAYPGRQAIPSIPERSWSTRFRCVPSASAIHASAAPPYRGPDV